MSSDTLARYRAATDPLPTRQRTWFLHGAGMECLGKDGQSEEDRVPAAGPDELLVRCDATGLCFSDIKILNQGGEHVRIKPRDLSVNPVVMGHESVVTVVGIGANLAGQFHVGERYVVQADIYVNGKTHAYGYVLPGALTQYETMGQAVLNGDDGCYLIPIKPTTGYAEAALTEPWACVVHSYLLEYRHGAKAGGVCLMVGGAGADGMTLGDTFAGGAPRRIVAAVLPPALLAAVQATGAEVVEIACAGQCGGPDDLVARFTDGAGYDDIIICGTVNDDCLEALAGKLSRGGVMNVVGATAPSRPMQVDVGRIHYEDWLYVGNPGTDIGASYAWQRTRTDLKPGGTALMLGAGGPMGQMHVQRACEMPDGPSLIVATDIDAARLAELRERFIPAAEAHGRTLVVLNPTEFTPETFQAELTRLSSGNGFDDVVALVPVPAIITQAAANVGVDGLLNIFAGVARGTCVPMKLEDVYLRGARWVGSSGSFISDMRETLRMAESGELLTGNAVAAIGGLNAVYHGLELVKGQAVPGKIVIYQQIEDMPIIRLPELKDVMPTVAAKLRDGKYWTVEAEDELLRVMLPAAP
jgi:threonine dehydrogenase-like Zn-dependent dehydrogenase